MTFDRDKWKREYRKKNKEKLNARRRELYAKKIHEMSPEELKEYREKMNNYVRKWRSEHPGFWKKYKPRETSKEFGDRWRAIHMLSLNNVCLFCGFDNINALEFHHLNPAEKDNPKEVRSAGADLTKFILLCANCHKILHAEIKKQ